MAVNQGLVPILEMMAGMGQIDWSTMTAAGARAAMDTPMPVADPIPMARVEEVTIPLDGRTLSARLYVPEGAGANPPLLLFYHGGGFVIGTLDTHDNTARDLARASGAAVLSVAYRLAPEAPYPAAAEDAYDALVWASQNGAALGVDGSRLTVAGDSAGGNLAAATAIMARDRGGPALRHQLLLYPVTDRDFSRPSYAANGKGNYMLGTDAMEWFWRQYAGDAPAKALPLGAVVHTADLTGLPPATILTAEYDPLLDEGRDYAERLRTAGVSVDHHTAPGMIHGFISMAPLVPDVGPWVTRAGAAVREALA